MFVYGQVYRGDARHDAVIAAALRSALWPTSADEHRSVSLTAMID